MKKLKDLKEIIDGNLGAIDISKEAKENLIKVAYKRNNKKIFRIALIPIAASFMIVFFIVGIMPRNQYDGSKVAHAKDLMKEIKYPPIEDKGVSQNFTKASRDFSINLFKSSIRDKENTLISPLSVYIALAMTANGAEKETLDEFIKVLGQDNLTIEDINNCCYTMIKSFKESGKGLIANSVWYRDDDKLKVSEKFLETNGSYYGADAYKTDFTSYKAKEGMNGWIEQRTKGLIKEVINETSKEAIMYLINTLYFDCQWSQEYKNSDVRQGIFNLTSGKKCNVDFMYSEEMYTEDNMAKGFIKPYEGNKYSFVALMPNEGTNLKDYVEALNGEKFLNLIERKNHDFVMAALPKFKGETNIELKDNLKKMGLNSAFNKNNKGFSKMLLDNNDSIYIDRVLHKTYIEVGEKGTKAGGTTVVEIEKGSAINEKLIILDRPFLYSIVDNDTGIPLFIGTMENPQ